MQRFTEQEWAELPLRKKLELIAAHPDATKDPVLVQQILELRQTLEDNPLQFFEPYPKQITFLRSGVQGLSVPEERGLSRGVGGDTACQGSSSTSGCLRSC